VRGAVSNHRHYRDPFGVDNQGSGNYGL
jgi:hypothetical protein